MPKCFTAKELVDRLATGGNTVGDKAGFEKTVKELVGVGADFFFYITALQGERFTAGLLSGLAIGLYLLKEQNGNIE